MSYSSFPTSVIGPSFPVDISVEPRILRTEFGDGYTSEAPDGINYLLKVFGLTWEAVTTDEKNTIINFIESMGGYQTFQWTYDSTTYLVKCRKWTVSQSDPGIYRIQVEFNQVPI